MAQRTTNTDVRSVIDTDPAIDLQIFINTAYSIVDHIVSNDSSGILSDNIARAIETYLAAHFYALRDQQFESKTTGDASAKFQTGNKGKGFLATDWGSQAVALDLTGQLAEIAEGVFHTEFIWLGKPTSQQIDFRNRD